MSKIVKPDTIDWLFNQPDARKAIRCIRARNLTVIEATVCESVMGKMQGTVIASYDKMVMFSGKEADKEVLKWMRKFPLNDEEGRYIYFRFKRWN